MLPLFGWEQKKFLYCALVCNVQPCKRTSALEPSVATEILRPNFKCLQNLVSELVDMIASLKSLTSCWGGDLAHFSTKIWFSNSQVFRLCVEVLSFVGNTSILIEIAWEAVLERHFSLVILLPLLLSNCRVRGLADWTVIISL